MSTVDLLSRLGERFGSSIPLPLIFSPDGSVLNSEPGERLGHFAFAYHHIDPSNIMISIGKYAGQFWVKGKAPDLANIAGRGGGVKYELIRGPLAVTAARSCAKTPTRCEASCWRGCCRIGS